jgi:uncharacterized membrane protein
MALRIGPIDKADGIRWTRARVAARALLAMIYLAAGIFHLAIPDTFLMITPDWVPFPRDTILATGMCEIVGAVALMTTRLRRAAGYALALYAVCVFPANVKHAFGDLPPGAVHLGWWYHVPRLAFQPVLVWWALFAGEIVAWPFTSKRDGGS